jgi:excisionase family DNA binding protein
MHSEVKPQWVTYAEAQRLVGLGRTTLWRLVSSGDVRAARVGRAVRIDRKSLEEFMERTATTVDIDGQELPSQQR